ncbi:MAG: nitronate monooxygenase [Caulobacter sp.]|nr:nitronate monooxygenase [Caulobacter sp.]
MTAPRDLFADVRLPVMAAPMFIVSSLELAIACCRAGVVAAWQAGNPRTVEEFGHWLDAIAVAERESRDRGEPFAPHAVNLITSGREPELAQAKLALCEKARVPLLVTSLGDPAETVKRAHGWGGLVIHDATTLRFAEKAIAAGVDGLLLVCAGAGGHTGHLSPFAFIPAVRRRFGGLILAAGGIADGAGVAAALALGADMACLGTRFIATRESGAPEGQKEMLAAARMEDVIQSDSFSGIPAHWLKGSLIQHGLDPANLPPKLAVRQGAILPDDVKPWKDLWSGGHSTGLIDDVPSVAQVVDRLCAEFAAARLHPDWRAQASRRLLHNRVPV